MALVSYLLTITPDFSKLIRADTLLVRVLFSIKWERFNKLFKVSSKLCKIKVMDAKTHVNELPVAATPPANNCAYLRCFQLPAMPSLKDESPSRAKHIIMQKNEDQRKMNEKST